MTRLLNPRLVAAFGFALLRGLGELVMLQRWRLHDRVRPGR